MPRADDDEIRLLEVSENFLATGEVWPITFGKARDLPFRMTVIQLTPQEFESVKQGNDPRLKLPDGWDVNQLTPVDPR